MPAPTHRRHPEERAARKLQRATRRENRLAPLCALKPALPAPHPHAPSLLVLPLTTPLRGESPPTVSFTFHLLTFSGSGRPQTPPTGGGESAPPRPAISGEYDLSIRGEAVVDWLRGSSWAGKAAQSLRKCPGGRGDGPAASAHAPCTRSAGGSDGGSVCEAGAAEPPGFGVVSQVRGAGCPG